jgi:hypothetical protein
MPCGDRLAHRHATDNYQFSRAAVATRWRRARMGWYREWASPAFHTRGT